ncbi:hypothetical protein HMPREF1982_00865 [Clostridiales bacterium oral taxon 876 str. F0540]|nr:hypothetical protein HMPREF1982_00865 [Clostridiales bacterium oral taxon 876 str. F0540]
MFIGEIVSVYANEECLDKGRPNALKVKPTVLMDTGYFDLNTRVGSIFKACSGNK